MPTGPKGQKCPADVIGNAVKVMRTATGEESEGTPSKPGFAQLRRGVLRWCLRRGR